MSKLTRAARSANELLESLTTRLAHRTLTDGQKSLITHDDPDLVEAFASLGWEDPHIVPEPEPPALPEHLPGVGDKPPDLGDKPPDLGDIKPA